jgi:hypothetical protein
VAPLVVAKAFDVLLNSGACIGPGLGTADDAPVRFSGSPEAFHGGVVIAVPFARHGRLHAELLNQLLIIMSTILAELAPQLSATRLVYLADREAGMMPLMARARDLGLPDDWLVRAKHNRCLPGGDKLWAHNCAGEPLGRIEFVLPALPEAKLRTVRQQLWARRIDLPAGKG